MRQPRYDKEEFGRRGDETYEQTSALPRVKRIARTDRDRSTEFGWLARNAESYRGKWVALLGDRLVSCADSLKELLASLDALLLEDKPLIHHID